MGAPLIKKVLKKRRLRRRKLHLLRRKTANSKTEAEKKKLLEKESRIAPWLWKKDFLREEKSRT